MVTLKLEKSVYFKFQVCQNKIFSKLNIFVKSKNASFNSCEGHCNFCAKQTVYCDIF